MSRTSKTGPRVQAQGELPIEHHSITSSIERVDSVQRSVCTRPAKEWVSVSSEDYPAGGPWYCAERGAWEPIRKRMDSWGRWQRKLQIELLYEVVVGAGWSSDCSVFRMSKVRGRVGLYDSHPPSTKAGVDRSLPPLLPEQLASWKLFRGTYQWLHAAAQTVQPR